MVCEADRLTDAGAEVIHMAENGFRRDGEQEAHRVALRLSERTVVFQLKGSFHEEVNSVVLR